MYRLFAQPFVQAQIKEKIKLRCHCRIGHKPRISGANAKRLWGQVGWMLADHRDGLSSSSFLAWSSIAQSVCQWAFSLLAIWCLRPWWVRILLSAEEDNLSPFDSNIACLCQSIEINNNKHDDVIKWKHFSRFWPFVRGIHRSPRGFYVFFDLRLDKRLSKHSWGWWFNTLSRPLWRHSNEHLNNII